MAKPKGIQDIQMSGIQFLERENKPKLAYVNIEAHNSNADKPVIVFLGGFRSDMGGTKAVFLQQHCLKQGLGYLRLDYSGHGDSNGNFNDGTISIWKDDALDVIETVLPGKDVILVGSSMGGWIGLLLSLQYKTHVKGFIGIAAAPDFSLNMYKKMSGDEKVQLETQGYIEVPNDYSDEPYRISKSLIDDGAKNALLTDGMDLDIPVTLIQGKLDGDVPWQHALSIRDSIRGSIAQVILIEEADHRLSRDSDLKRLADEIDLMVADS